MFWRAFGGLVHAAQHEAITNQEDQMRRLRLRRPNAALIVSTIVLILALGGTSYAAFTLPKNSVGTKQIKNGAVTTKKLANGATVANAVHAGSALTAGSAINATHATSADNATNAANAANATNASKVGGLTVKQFFMDRGPSTAPTAQLNLDGIVLMAGCNASSDAIVTVENDSGVRAALREVSFGAGEADDGTGIFTTAFDLTNGKTQGAGEFTVARSDGKVVTGQLMFRSLGVFGASDCMVSGTVTAS
jgi:hypothetical protein